MLFSGRAGIMLQRVVDDVKERTGDALRLTSLAMAIAFAAFITFGFLCGALFVYMLQAYGPIEACLVCAAVFFVVALVAATIYAVRRRRMRERAEQLARSRPSILADPMVVATGLQLVRAIGVKRLVPIIAIGGIALGIMASRNAAASPAPEETPAE
jgi:hypothetical protein